MAAQGCIAQFETSSSSRPPTGILTFEIAVGQIPHPWDKKLNNQHPCRTVQYNLDEYSCLPGRTERLTSLFALSKAPV